MLNFFMKFFIFTLTIYFLSLINSFSIDFCEVFELNDKVPTKKICSSLKNKDICKEALDKKYANWKSNNSPFTQEAKRRSLSLENCQNILGITESDEQKNLEITVEIEDINEIIPLKKPTDHPTFQHNNYLINSIFTIIFILLLLIILINFPFLKKFFLKKNRTSYVYENTYKKASRKDTEEWANAIKELRKFREKQPTRVQYSEFPDKNLDELKGSNYHWSKEKNGYYAGHDFSRGNLNYNSDGSLVKTKKKKFSYFGALLLYFGALIILSNGSQIIVSIGDKIEDFNSQFFISKDDQEYISFCKKFVFNKTNVELNDNISKNECLNLFNVHRKEQVSEIQKRNNYLYKLYAYGSHFPKDNTDKLLQNCHGDKSAKFKYTSSTSLNEVRNCNTHLAVKSIEIKKLINKVSYMYNVANAMRGNKWIEASKAFTNAAKAFNSINSNKTKSYITNQNTFNLSNPGALYGGTVCRSSNGKVIQLSKGKYICPTGYSETYNLNNQNHFGKVCKKNTLDGIKIIQLSKGKNICPTGYNEY